MKGTERAREIVYSSITVNNILMCLKLMLGEAVRLGIIPKNPAVSVEKLRETPKEKRIMSIEELRALFDEDTISTVWSGDINHGSSIFHVGNCPNLPATL
jgi:hypothetical protein